MKIGVTGGTGFIGSHLTEFLVEQGHEVTCLARNPKQLRWIRNLPIRIAAGDVVRPESLKDFVGGLEIVVHAAGITKALSIEEFMRANTTGTENLLKAVSTHNPGLERFVFISSMSATGPSSAGLSLSEDAPRRPISPYGVSKARAEEIAEGYRDRIPITIIRPPFAFGPRDRDLYAYFKLLSMKLQPFLGYENTFSSVYVKNLIRGISLAMTDPRGIGRCFFITDDGQFTWESFGALIASALKTWAFKIRVPPLIVGMIASFSELYSTVTRRPVRLNRDWLQEAKQPCWLVSGDRAKAKLGYRQAFTTEQGLSQTAAWYRAEGWL